MSQFIPRFRGRVLPKGSGFTFEIYITIGPDSDDNTLTMSAPKDQTYLNHEAAMVAMRALIDDVMKVVCEKMGLGTPTGIHDLKAGVFKSMDEWSKPKKVTS